MMCGEAHGDCANAYGQIEPPSDEKASCQPLLIVHETLPFKLGHYHLSTRLGVSNPNNQPLAQGPSSASNRVQRNGDILRIKQTVKLRTARVKFLCKGLFGFLFLFHGFCKLP